MTTEHDFYAALDLNPDDWQTRLVFADWLQDHDDPRAEGYRALGRLRRVPQFVWPFFQYSSERGVTVQWGTYNWHVLPTDWYGFTVMSREPGDTHWHEPARVKNARQAEDAAALQFLKLVPARRAEPAPGTKRYVLLRGADLVFETDDKAEALALILSGTLGDALCDREFKPGRYTRVTPCSPPTLPPYSPPPIATIGIQPPSS